MQNLAAEMVTRRRAHPTEKKDILNALILGRDPVTGEEMTDQSIMDNMITLLIAGHETTSGLVPFCFLLLLQNSAAYLKAQKEVDDVVGRETLTVKHLSGLLYLNAVLRETMRLHFPVPSLSRSPEATPDGKPILLGGKYEVKPGAQITSIVHLIQRDPAIYGADSEEFKPERMLDEEFNKRPANAWKPFGTGVRGCIGKPFTWQEAHMMLAMLLQERNFSCELPNQFSLGDWQSTFYKIPKLVNSLMEQRGAKRIVDIGLSDAASGEIFNDFDKFLDDSLYPALRKLFSVSGDPVGEETGVKIDITEQSRSTTLRQDIMKALVIENKILTAPGEPKKKHLLLKLPSGMAYTAGDYLAILSLNGQSAINGVIKRFKLPWDAMLKITSTNNIHLPTDHPVSAYDVLSSYVEINQPATAKNIRVIAKYASDEHDKTELERLASEALASEITAKHVSCLGLLERFPNIVIPFEEFLMMLPPLRVRQYSISSSPLDDPTTCTLTYSVLDQSHWSGEGRFLGAASNYLDQLEANEPIQVAVRQSHQSFHLPTEIDQIPLILICAGAGVAPFRGFVQERAIQAKASRKLAPCMLFMGCCHPEHDTIYKDQFETWQALGAVNLQYAFSQDSETSGGCKHVQDRLWEQCEIVADLFRKNARIYVCGSRGVENGVTENLKKIYKEAAGKSDEEADVWFQGMRNTRYMTDVFD